MKTETREKQTPTLHSTHTSTQRFSIFFLDFLFRVDVVEKKSLYKTTYLLQKNAPIFAISGLAFISNTINEGDMMMTTVSVLPLF